MRIPAIRYVRYNICVVGPQVIKKQEQKLIDLQKTLRREIQSRGPDAGSSSKKPTPAAGGASGFTNGLASASESGSANGSRPSKELMLSSAVPDGVASKLVSSPGSRGGDQYEGDGSFEYMKHVLLKFILSKEAEVCICACLYASTYKTVSLLMFDRE